MHRFRALLPTLKASVLLTATLLTVLVWAARAQSPTTVTITTQAGRHSIDRNIYGVSLMDPSQFKYIKPLNDPNNRIGGNNVSTYNWDLVSHAAAGSKPPAGDAMNLDNDWFWESYLMSATPGGYYDSIIAADKNAGVGTQTMATIPMMPWIATVGPDATTSAASRWSFSIKKYGKQIGDACSSYDYLGGSGYAYDEWQTDAGSGIASMNGCNVTWIKNDPSDAYVKNSPAYQQAYVTYLVKKYGGAAHGGIKYYILDNEPSIWSGTHEDIHPAAQTYDEYWADVVAYATVIRAADPDAIIVGPEEWSWWGMWLSGNDQAGLTPSDYSTHNNTYYYPWLLQQLAAYKKAHGVSLIDMLSVHCYDDGSAAPAVATRKLWDPNYKDPGWYIDGGLNNGVLDWIPLMRKWVAQNNPGMTIACSEYTNWADQDTLTGAVTQADMLGIFGQYGYSLASHYGAPAYPSLLAFQLYTNYDGKNSGFGETGVQTAVANPDKLAAFSAVRAADGALTVVVLNKQSTPAQVTLSLPDFVPSGSATYYQISSAGQTSLGAAKTVAVGGSGIVQTVPGPSATLFVIPGGSITKAPSTPTNLAATVGDRSVALTWTASVGASSYSLYRATSAAGPFTTPLLTQANTAGVSYTDKTVVNGVTYYYVIAAANKLGSSAKSTPAVAARPQVPPVFTLSASASPNPVVQNHATTLKAALKCTASALVNGVVELFAVDPNGKSTLVKKFTAVNLTSGQSTSLSAPFTPTVAGAYTLDVAVLSASGQQWASNAKAGAFTVNSALTFSSSATVPTTLAAGAKGTITVKVTNTGSSDLTNGIVQVAIFPPTGSDAVSIDNIESINLKAGASQTFTTSWTPATTLANGSYTVDIGVFDGAWTIDYYWNADATIKLTGGK